MKSSLLSIVGKMNTSQGKPENWTTCLPDCGEEKHKLLGFQKPGNILTQNRRLRTFFENSSVSAINMCVPHFLFFSELGQRCKKIFWKTWDTVNVVYLLLQCITNANYQVPGRKQAFRGSLVIYSKVNFRALIFFHTYYVLVQSHQLDEGKPYTCPSITNTTIKLSTYALLLLATIYLHIRQILQYWTDLLEHQIYMHPFLTQLCSPKHSPEQLCSLLAVLQRSPSPQRVLYLPQLPETTSI